VEGELLAANVVRLRWATTRDAERTSTSSDVGDGSERIWLSDHNSTLEAVILLNGSRVASCEDDDRQTSLLTDCDLSDNNVRNAFATALLLTLHCPVFKSAKLKQIGTTRPDGCCD